MFECRYFLELFFQTICRSPYWNDKIKRKEKKGEKKKLCAEHKYQQFIFFLATFLHDTLVHDKNALSYRFWCKFTCSSETHLDWDSRYVYCIWFIFFTNGWIIRSLKDNFIAGCIPATLFLFHFILDCQLLWFLQALLVDWLLRLILISSDFTWFFSMFITFTHWNSYFPIEDLYHVEKIFFMFLKCCRFQYIVFWETTGSA